MKHRANILAGTILQVLSTGSIYPQLFAGVEQGFEGSLISRENSRILRGA